MQSRNHAILPSPSPPPAVRRTWQQGFSCGVWRKPTRKRVVDFPMMALRGRPEQDSSPRAVGLDAPARKRRAPAFAPPNPSRKALPPAHLHTPAPLFSTHSSFPAPRAPPLAQSRNHAIPQSCNFPSPLPPSLRPTPPAIPPPPNPADSAPPPPSASPYADKSASSKYPHAPANPANPESPSPPPANASQNCASAYAA